MAHSILLPSQLKIVKEKENSGVYEIEGLYPGYGHTLGNSLRRIILSSIPGAAITSIKIDGVDHEFSVKEGLKEDIVTLLLNLKKVRFSLATDEPQTVTLSVKNPQIVTAADITASGQVEVLNPDQYIGEVTSKKSPLTMEMTIEKGLGFVPRKVSKKDKVSIGTIPVDAIFTPIRRVNYEVENMRVGDRTDHNRLRITIETDGTLTPREALEYSMKVMIEQIKAILDLKDIVENPPVIEEFSSADEKKDGGEGDDSSHDYADVLKTRIDTLDLSTRTINALTDASIRTLGGIAQKTEEDLLALDGIGAKGAEEIKDVLKSFNITLKG